MHNVSKSRLLHLPLQKHRSTRIYHRSFISISLSTVPSLNILWIEEDFWCRLKPLFFLSRPVPMVDIKTTLNSIQHRYKKEKCHVNKRANLLSSVRWKHGRSEIWGCTKQRNTEISIFKKNCSKKKEINVLWIIYIYGAKIIKLCHHFPRILDFMRVII